MNFQESLRKLGLSDKEASIYLHLLSVEHSSVLDISKKTDINRSTAYVILEQLISKGLVSEAPHGKKIHYRAESPHRLETYLEQQRVHLNDQANKIKGLIPQLKSIRREEGERPVVRYFEGREGIISSIAEFFTAPISENTVRFIYDEDLDKSFYTPDLVAHMRKLRKESMGDKDLNQMRLYTSSQGESSEAKEIDPNSKQLSKEKFPIKCEIAIYNNTVRIITMGKELTSTIIESKDFAETMISLFNRIYKE